MDEVLAKLADAGISFVSLQLPTKENPFYRANTKRGESWRIGQSRPTLEAALLEAAESRGAKTSPPQDYLSDLLE